jgi:hypothetical protein
VSPGKKADQIIIFVYWYTSIHFEENMSTIILGLGMRRGNWRADPVLPHQAKVTGGRKEEEPAAACELKPLITSVLSRPC